MKQIYGHHAMVMLLLAFNSSEPTVARCGYRADEMVNRVLGPTRFCDSVHLSFARSLSFR